MSSKYGHNETRAPSRVAVGGNIKGWYCSTSDWWHFEVDSDNINNQQKEQSELSTGGWPIFIQKKHWAACASFQSGKNRFNRPKKQPFKFSVTTIYRQMLKYWIGETRMVYSNGICQMLSLSSMSKLRCKIKCHGFQSSWKLQAYTHVQSIKQVHVHVDMQYMTCGWYKGLNY